MQTPSERKAWQEFLNFCSKLKTPERFHEFFELFLTINEREELLARYQIVKELLKGQRTQREIAEDFKVNPEVYLSIQ